MTAKEALDAARLRGGKDGLNCIAELVDSLPTQTDAALPLAGMPVLVKDNIDVRGLHTTAGSLALADNLAESDAPIIRNLRRNGAVILGKTNMTEFANFTTAGMPAGYSSRGGQVIHAANPARDPCGSSTGSAVAVSAGIVPAAVGTDTSFSIILCALENGVCGIKPKVGALSSEGIIPISRTLDSAGALGKTFTDALSLYSAMRGTPLPALTPASPGELRIAVNIVNRDMFPADRQAHLARVLAALRKRGVSMGEVCEHPTGFLRVIMQWEFMPHLEDYLRTASASRKTLREIVDCYTAHPDTMMKYGISFLKSALNETPGGLAGAPYLEAMEARRLAIEKTSAEISAYDAVIVAGPTNIMHFCGFPSATVVGAETDEDGVPRGVMLYSTDELRLYRAALAIEQILQHPED